MNENRPYEGTESVRREGCKTIAWKIGPFVDGELPPAERDEVEAHLAACKDCVEMAVEFRKLDAAASRDKVPPVTGEEWARVWEGTLAGGKAATAGKILHFLPASRIKRWMLPALAAAALFIAGVFVGTTLLDRTNHVPELGKQQPLAGQSNNNLDDVAAKRSGPAPDIQVEGDVIFIDYSNF